MLVANCASKEVIDLFIDQSKATVSLSSELFPLLWVYSVLPFSPFLLYMSFFNSFNSPRFQAYCSLLPFCLSHASLGSHFFPSLLFSGSFLFAMQLFLQFLTFPISGRSIMIALSGNVQLRIKPPFPFQNILSRPSRSDRRTIPLDTPGQTMDLWVEFYLTLSESRAVGIMGRRNNGPSE